MGRSVPHIPDAELAVLHLLWERGPAPVRQLADALYPGGGAAEYATVQKLLDRLEGKGCVRRDRRGPAHTFTAALGRDELIGRRLRDMAEKLCGGSLTPLLMNLVRAKPLSNHELQELQAALDELSRQAKPKGKSR